MKTLATLLSVGSMLTGIVAAFFWFRASRPPSESRWWQVITMPTELMGLYDTFRWVYRDALDSAKLNRIASLWTAVSVILAGAASMASSFSN